MRVLFALAAVALLAGSTAADEKKSRPRVEVVFCLDTTGSMGGLIEGAKAKIWAISNQIANGKPTPDLKVGLVAYRDKNDAYVTQVHDLTDDLDAVHGNLKTFAAAGGGDTPEHVNQALFDSVHKIKWSPDARTLKIIFLVGDAPPQMNYADDVKYPETCKKAVEKGIIINTIQCGADAECARAWQDICKKSEGTFVAIRQDGGVLPVVSTPFDRRLGEINGELAGSTLVFGRGEARKEAEDKKSAARDLSAPKAPPGTVATAAERAAFQAKAGRVAAFDLLDQVKEGKVKLEELKKEELPDALQKMTTKEQKEYLDKLDAKRKALMKEAQELDRQRSNFIKKELDRQKQKGGFDEQVLEMLRQQAKKHKIDY